MNPEDFRLLAKEAIDYIIDYMENIRSRPVLPSVQPGYLHKLMPSEAPKTPDDWRQIIPDIESLIMPGLTHWLSPKFNAFYPSVSSYPSVVGDIISSGLGCIVINWFSSPACTELEVIVLDWLSKLMDLPECFWNTSKGPGGSTIQTSASEGILFALFIAREKKTKEILEDNPTLDEGFVKGKLVAYSSDQSNSSIEKAGKLGSMRMKLLPCDQLGKLSGETLSAAIEQDKANGLIPCYVIATLGTTGTCAFDDLTELGPICNKERLWLHIDAAYAGAAFVCPEYRHLMEGIQWADSIDMNPHKWLLVNFDCAVFWIKDRRYMIEPFSVDRIYLKGKDETIDNLTPNYRDWEIALGRRFRALKLWFTMRLYGQTGLQKHIRNHVTLAKKFEALVRQDQRFEIITPVQMGLVCFRLKGDSSLTKDLIHLITVNKELYMNDCTFRGIYFIRYVVSSRDSSPEDIVHAWKVISTYTNLVISRTAKATLPLPEEKHKGNWETNVDAMKDINLVH